MSKVLVFLLAFAFANFAEAGNRQIVHQGRILRPDGSPVDGNFRMEARIYSPDSTQCLMWGESKDVAFSKGSFSYELGDSTRRMTGLAGGRSVSFASVFLNDAAFTLTAAQCENGSTYTPNSADERRLVITLYDGPTAIKAYDGAIKSVPYAIESHNSSMVGGYNANHILKFNESGSHQPSMTFSTVGASLLWNLAETTAPNLGGKQLKGLLEPSAPSDAATLKTVNDAVGALTGGSSGIGTVVRVAAESASSILQITGSPFTETGTLSFSFPSQSAGTFFAAPIGAAGAPSFRGISASDIPALDVSKLTSGTLPVSLGGTGLGNFTGYAILAANMTGSAIEQRTCANGEVLEWQTSNGFVCVSRLSGAGVVSNITAGTGLLGGPIITTGTLSVDVGLTNGKIVAVGAGDKIPVALIPNLSTDILTSGTLGVNRGGTGLVPAAGNADQFYAINAAGTGSEFKSIIAGTGVNISHSTGSTVISASGSGGTVTNVGASVPSYMSVSPGNITSSGTFDFSFNSQGAALVFAAPTGSSGAPVFRALASTDLPNLDASKITSGTLNVSHGGTGIGSLTANALLMANPTGSAVISAVCAPEQFMVWKLAGGWSCENKSTGAVTRVDLTVPTSIFALTGGPVTSDGTFNVTLQSQAANTIFAAPTGGSGTPTFRTLAASDIPNLDISKLTSGTLGVDRGGTGLVPVAGNSNQLYGINNAGNAAEFKTLTAGTGLSINYSAGTIDLSVAASGMSQWLNNANGIHYVAGSIGIGTTSPTYILDVRKSQAGSTIINIGNPNTSATANAGINIAADASNSYLVQGSSTSATTGIIRPNATVFNGSGNGGLNISASDAAGQIRLFTNGGQQRLIVDQAGNVGIGTNTPQAKLDVNGVIRATDICDETGANCKKISTGWAAGGDFKKDGSVAMTGSLQMGATATKISTAGTELMLEQAGDTYGPTRLILQNRNGMNGAIFQNAAIDLVDFGFLPSSGAQNNIRLEHRVSSLINSGNTAGEFQLIDPSASPTGDIWLATGKNVTTFNMGNVGIGTKTPSQKLEVVGNVLASSFLVSSDQRLKYDIQNIKNAIDAVMKIKGVHFKWKENGREDIGFIAQQIETVLPELVHTNPESGIKSVQYSNVVAVLVAAIQEQQLALAKEKELNLVQNRRLDEQERQIRQIQSILNKGENK